MNNQDACEELKCSLGEGLTIVCASLKEKIYHNTPIPQESIDILINLIEFRDGVEKEFGEKPCKHHWECFKRIASGEDSEELCREAINNTMSFVYNLLFFADLLYLNKSVVNITETLTRILGEDSDDNEEDEEAA